MSRILICVPVFEPSTIYGGPATVAADHARWLAQRGHSVSVLTTNLASIRPLRRHDLQRVEKDGIEIHYLPAFFVLPHFSLLVAPGLPRWIDRELHRFDVVHIHFGRELFQVACASGAHNWRIPYVLQTHGMLHRSRLQHRVVDRLLTRKVLREAAAVLALQSEEERQLKAIEPTSRIARIANAVEFAPGPPAWTADRLRDPKIVFLARLQRVKRVLDLVEAAALLERRGVRARYEIIGPDSGDLAPARKRVAELGLQGAFDFVGELSREAAMQRLREAAIHAQPSSWECFSMTTIEALSFGVPSVVTTGNELWRELRDAGAALVTEPGAEAFADGLEKMLKNPELATDVSTRGRAWAAQNCARDVVVQRLEEIYRGAQSARR